MPPKNPTQTQQKGCESIPFRKPKGMTGMSFQIAAIISAAVLGLFMV